MTRLQQNILLIIAWAVIVMIGSHSKPIFKEVKMNPNARMPP